MIGADRRGMQAAYEAVSRYPQGISGKKVESIARKVLATMRDAGYAHLDPESDFIRGFVQGFQQCSASCSAGRSHVPPCKVERGRSPLGL